MDYPITDLSDSRLLSLYKGMLLPRLIEEKMLVLLRQGKISKWFSGIGQEAISVGVTHCLKDSEYILPMHRNLGVFTSRSIPLNKLFAQWQGKPSGFTKGRDRSFHFGDQKSRIIGMISHLGPQLGVANGIALADLLKGESEITAVFTGEGGTSEGDFHEALNIASVWGLPVLFCIENNAYGLSTPTSEQYNCKDLADRGVAYGMESHIIDGNNIVEVYLKVRDICAEMREHPRPVLVEFKTFRMRGHEEASGTKYVPEELLQEWESKDPLINYRNYLLSRGILSEQADAEIRNEFNTEIQTNLDIAFNEKEAIFNLSEELDDVFHKFIYQDYKPEENANNIRFVDAVSQGLYQSMERHENLLLLGQDIAEYGGVFKVTEGFSERFGKDRVRNTPICESSVVEAAMGLSINGMKSVVEMQFGDFVSSGFNPIVNYLAKVHYRWQQAADVVVRMPCGAGVGAGPFHSQTNEAWFTKVAGLKVVYPAFPADAKGLLCTAINDPNPVLFFEHKALYRSVYGDVAENYYTLPLGKANLVRGGEQLSIITFGAGVHWALELLDEFSEYSIELLDLRSLHPLDTEAIFKSVRKTNRVILLQEDSIFGGIMSDVAALIGEHCFESLDAPVKRVASLQTPIPFAKTLETGYLPKERLRIAVQEVLAY